MWRPPFHQSRSAGRTRHPTAATWRDTGSGRHPASGCGPAEFGAGAATPCAGGPAELEQAQRANIEVRVAPWPAPTWPIGSRRRVGIREHDGHMDVLAAVQRDEGPVTLPLKYDVLEFLYSHARTTNDDLET